MQLSHAVPVRSAVFDEPNLVSHAGLVPAMGLAARAGLIELADRQLTVPGGAGHAAGLKVSALVAGMVTGADSIADMAVLRHGGMGRLFTGVRAPSTLGTFLRAFRFGHVRQLDAVAARFLTGLTGHAPLISTAAEVTFVDIDDTVRSTYGYAKQGAGYGYSGVKGLNAFLATRVHGVVGAGDRRDPAAEGVGELRAGRGQVGRRRPGHHPQLRDDRDGGAAGGQRVLRPGGDRRRPPGRGQVLHHRPQGPRGHRRDQRDPRRCVDDHPVPEGGVRRAARAVGVRR